MAEVETRQVRFVGCSISALVDFAAVADTKNEHDQAFVFE